MATDRKLLPESWRQFARLMVITSGAGVAISALLWLPQRQDPLLTAVMIGALVGACIYLTTLGLAWIFRRGLGRLEGMAASLAICAIFFVAGVVGWTLVAAIAFWIARGTVGGNPAEWRSTLLVAGGLGLGVGIGIFPGPRLPLGLKLGVAYETLEETLDPGDRLLFVTDGLPEAPQSSSGEPLGYAAFEALLSGLEGDPAAAMAHVFAAVDAVSVDTRADDWTALLLERAR
jgi:Stage II sporulation protein E (SpoIIE)